MMSKCGRMVLCCLVGMTLASTVQANLITNGDMELGGSATIPPMGWDYLDGPMVGVLGVSSDTPSGMGQSLSVM